MNKSKFLLVLLVFTAVFGSIPLTSFRGTF